MGFQTTLQNLSIEKISLDKKLFFSHEAGEKPKGAISNLFKINI